MDFNEYRDVLGKATTTPEDRDLFSNAITGALELNLFENERELGHKFGVCREQVNRWKDGRDLTIIGARKAIYKALDKRVGL